VSPAALWAVPRPRRSPGSLLSSDEAVRARALVSSRWSALGCVSMPARLIRHTPTAAPLDLSACPGGGVPGWSRIGRQTRNTPRHMRRVARASRQALLPRPGGIEALPRRAADHAIRAEHPSLTNWALCSHCSHETQQLKGCPSESAASRARERCRRRSALLLFVRRGSAGTGEEGTVRGSGSQRDGHGWRCAHESVVSNQPLHTGSIRHDLALAGTRGHFHSNTDLEGRQRRCYRAGLTAPAAAETPR